MVWVTNYLPIILSSGAILIVLFVVKRALDWAEWKGGTETFKVSVEDTLKEIKESIAKIEDRIVEIFEKIGPSTTGPGSPIGLTDLGKTVSGELDASDWATDKGRELLPQFKDKTPYEIQDLCFHYVRGPDFTPSPGLMEKAQSSAFEHGITIDQVFRVFAIELRDALLSLTGQSPPDD